MKTEQVIYGVIESDANGVKKDLSHWTFTSYSDAIKFAEKMRASNADCPEDFQFVVITLVKGKA